MMFQSQKRQTRQWKCAISPIRHMNHNGEVIGISWLCFSPSQTCIHCFACRLMCADTTKCAHFLIRKGICDWNHALERLRSQEQSVERIDATITLAADVTNHHELMQS